jgi:hypothetical protein
MYAFGKRFIPAMQIVQPKFKVAVISSHFYCSVPYDDQLEITHLDLHRHVLAITPMRIKRLEDSLPIELKQPYLDYLWPETLPTTRYPRATFEVTKKGVYPTKYSTELERQLVTAIGLSFLDAETIDESEKDLCL